MEKHYSLMINFILRASLASLILMLGGCQKEAIAENNQGYTGAYSLLGLTLQPEMQKCGVDQGEFDRLLALPQEGFDQDFTGGWRAISNKDGCNNAAAEMIKAYILYSVPHPPNNLSILRWHAGQTKAGAGEYDEAAALFAGTYKPDTDPSPEWDLYVKATIAFLQNDLPALQIAHDTLAAFPVAEEVKSARRQFLKDNPNITMPDNFVDEPQNLSPVKNLLACFGKPYSEAYGNCEK